MLRKIFCFLVLISLFSVIGCRSKTVLMGSDYESTGKSVYLKDGYVSVTDDVPVSNSGSVFSSSTTTSSESITENTNSEKEAAKEIIESKTEFKPSETYNYSFPNISENDKCDAEEI